MAPSDKPPPPDPCPKCGLPGCFLWRVVLRHTPMTGQPQVPMLEEVLDAVLREPDRAAQLRLLDDFYLRATEQGCSTAMGVVSDASAKALGLTLPSEQGASTVPATEPPVQGASGRKYPPGSWPLALPLRIPQDDGAQVFIEAIKLDDAGELVVVMGYRVSRSYEEQDYCGSWDDSELERLGFPVTIHGLRMMTEGAR